MIHARLAACAHTAMVGVGPWILFDALAPMDAEPQHHGRHESSSSYL
jgi:hypothetical protein